MFKKQMNKIKELLPISSNNENKNKDKRKTENLIVFLIILIITLIAINTILKTEKKGNTNNQYNESVQEVVMPKEKTYYDDLETKIENILATMSGVRQSKSVNYIFTIISSNGII